MCIILPVSHVPCTHTTAIWQHCIEAAQCGPYGLQPCSDVKQHAKAVLTRRPCEECSDQRHFARRGGVAERGNTSSITPLEPGLKTNDLDDDADDSGYHSDVIHEEDEASDHDECPISPKAQAPPQIRVKANRQRKHGSSNHRALTRKPSWKPNLKRDLNFEYEPVFPAQQQPQPRRDSIDSLLSQFDAAVDMSYQRGESRNAREEYSFRSTSPPSPRPSRRLRNSTLLHPSSPPPAETMHHAQMAQSYTFPQLVDIRRSPPSHSSASRMRKNSTLLHPSSPTFEPAHSPSPSPPNTRLPERRLPIPRRASSLLHPSLPDDPPIIDLAHHRTILSFPPRSMTDPQRYGYENTRPDTQLRRMPPLQSSRSEPTTTVRRKKSVLHSCLSDGEEDEQANAQRLFGRRESGEREGGWLRERGRVAREGRRRV